MFICVKHVVIYNINATQYKWISYAEISKYEKYYFLRQVHFNSASRNIS